MKQIRHSVFETNSSSTHSLTINNKALMPTALYVDDCYPDKIAVRFGEYGWGPDTLVRQGERLSYLCTLFWELECGGIADVNDIYKKNGYRIIDAAVFNHTKRNICLDGIKVEDGWLAIDGYVDHKSSTEKYMDISDFLAQNNLTAGAFIFGDVSVKISNDNI